MSNAQIPSFSAPNPPDISPYADLVEAHIQAYGDRLGLARTSEGRNRLKAGYGTFVAWTYPAAFRDDLYICAEWLFNTFVLDDLHTLSRYDSPQAWASVHRRLQAIIETGQDQSDQPRTPFTQAIANVSHRTRQRVSSDFFQRFVRHLDLFFTGFGRESQNRLRGTVPNLTDFTEVRRWSVGMEFGFDLVEFSHQVEVPGRVYATPLYQTLIEAASDIVAWQNDMHSLPLDIERGDLHNLVIVLQKAEGIAEKAASDLAAAKISQRITDFTDAEDALPPLLRGMRLSTTEQEGILRSVAGMRQWANGCLAWYRNTTRYAVPGPSSNPDSQHAYLQRLIGE